MKRYNSMSVLNALEYGIVFHGCCRPSMKKILSGLSRDNVARLASLLTRAYCNRDAENVIYMLSTSDKRREKLLRRVVDVEEQCANQGIGLVVAFDITPLEILRIAMSMNPESMKDVPEDETDRIQFDIVKLVMEVNEDSSDIEFARFLDTALGSAFEVETQLLIAKNVGYLGNANVNDNANGVTYEELLGDLQEIERQINGLIGTIRGQR